MASLRRATSAQPAAFVDELAEGPFVEFVARLESEIAHPLSLIWAPSSTRSGSAIQAPYSKPKWMCLRSGAIQARSASLA
jgi:hypothetical protein